LYKVCVLWCLITFLSFLEEFWVVLFINYYCWCSRLSQFSSCVGPRLRFLVVSNPVPVTSLAWWLRTLSSYSFMECVAFYHQKSCFSISAFKQEVKRLLTILDSFNHSQRPHHNYQSSLYLTVYSVFWRIHRFNFIRYILIVGLKA
jgi:hypothetical protein